MYRDEKAELIAAIGHADALRKLLQAGHDLDAEADGGPFRGTLRGFLMTLKPEIDAALQS